MPGGRVFKHKGPALELSLECRRNREAVGVASVQSRAECSGNSCGEPQSGRAAALSFSCTQGDHCLGISDTCYAALDFPIGTGSASKFNPSALHVAGIHTCLLSR